MMQTVGNDQKLPQSSYVVNNTNETAGEKTCFMLNLILKTSTAIQIQEEKGLSCCTNFSWRSRLGFSFKLEISKPVGCIEYS